MHIYLDNNSTTPLHKDVLAFMTESLTLYENPSSAHSSGMRIRKMIEHAREHCAALIHAEADDIIFTSGGTESNNTVLSYTHVMNLCSRNKSRNEVVVSTIEHHSVLNCAKALEKCGVKVHYAPVDSKGNINLDRYVSLLSEKTALVSIMLVNNEIGTIQDIKKLAVIAHKKGALMHTDAVQAIGKMPVDVKDLDVDYLSYTGHKFYGPKGTGVLYIKKSVPFTPLHYGGKQEKGRRAGTENILGIIGIGKAAEIVKINIDRWNEKYSQLKNKLVDGITGSIENVQVNGDQKNSVPQTMNISFIGTEGETVLVYLDNKGISVSTGAACSSGSISHVLNAIGLDNKTANSAIRFSLGYHNTEKQIEYTIKELQKIIPRVRNGIM
ncbi:MAG: cysteine desulfurase family protein [Bacteroidota bacterium]|jgi:cysteine desulfurase